jgi:hypothetical protein
MEGSDSNFLRGVRRGRLSEKCEPLRYYSTSKKKRRVDHRMIEHHAPVQIRTGGAARELIGVRFQFFLSVRLSLGE